MKHVLDPSAKILASVRMNSIPDSLMYVPTALLKAKSMWKYPNMIKSLSNTGGIKTLNSITLPCNGQVVSRNSILLPCFLCYCHCSNHSFPHHIITDEWMKYLVHVVEALQWLRICNKTTDKSYMKSTLSSFVSKLCPGYWLLIRCNYSFLTLEMPPVSLFWKLHFLIWSI